MLVLWSSPSPGPLKVTIVSGLRTLDLSRFLDLEAGQCQGAQAHEIINLHAYNSVKRPPIMTAKRSRCGHYILLMCYISLLLNISLSASNLQNALV